MIFFGILFGVALLGIYLTLAIYCATKVWALSQPLKRDWTRVLLVAFVLALFFAPAVMGGGHGVGVGPAWFALLDPESNRFTVRQALASFPSTWASFFVVGLLCRRFNNPEAK